MTVRPTLLYMALLVLASCSGASDPEGAIFSNEAITLYPDSVTVRGEKATQTVALSSMHLRFAGAINGEWHVDRLPDGLPRFTVGMKLPDALYNRAVQTLADSATQALSPYATLLTLAYLNPERAMETLRAQVKNGRILSASTSAWPIDVSRVAWILAAYELYCVTGDRDWSAEMYDVAKLSLADDNHVNYNSELELYCGSMVPLADASRFYPEWMNAADIYSSFSLAANVLYCRAFAIMAVLGETLGENVSRYRDISRALVDAININFWQPDRRRYSQMLYGIFPVPSPLTENLGQAFAVLYGVATPEMAQRLMERTPLTPLGVPAVWPSDKPMIDPTVQAFWALAAAKTSNADMLMATMASMMAQVAGDPAPAEAAALLSLYFRVLAGVQFTPQGLRFSPVVPAEFAAEKMISGLRYRGAELSVKIHGTGSRIARFTIDGVGCSEPVVPTDLTGHHVIEITLSGSGLERHRLQEAPSALAAAPAPVLSVEGNTIIIGNFAKGTRYDVWADGVFEQSIKSRTYVLERPDAFGVFAIAAEGGFTSRPLVRLAPEGELTVRADSFAVGGTMLMTDSLMAPQMVETSAIHLSHLGLQADVPVAGRYLIDVCYANGAGSVETQRYCGMRTLLVNGDRAGVFVMPQLGLGDWNATAYSNPLQVTLRQGVNHFAIDYLVPFNINAAASDNLLLIASLRLRRIPDL